MRVGPKDLIVWSFLMASAHGAGLMVLPLVMSGAAAPHHHMDAADAGAWVSATLIHSAGYLAVSAVLAVVVFRGAWTRPAPQGVVQARPGVGGCADRDERCHPRDGVVRLRVSTGSTFNRGLEPVAWHGNRAHDGAA